MHVIPCIEGRFEEGGTLMQASMYGSILPAAWSLMLALRARGLVKGQADRIKILGNGELTKSVTVTAHSFSKAAQEKIAKAGGKAVLVAAVQASATAE